jgi:hypothetical protein
MADRRLKDLFGSGCEPKPVRFFAGDSRGAGRRIRFASVHYDVPGSVRTQTCPLFL